MITRRRKVKEEKEEEEMEGATSQDDDDDDFYINLDPMEHLSSSINEITTYKKQTIQLDWKSGEY